MENVIHPKHYNHGKYEVIDVIEDWKLNFNMGNALKYIARWEANAETNNATTKQDFKNILKYLVDLIEEDKCPSCYKSTGKEKI